MPYEFKLERRVEFAETDMAGIVHFSNFFRYMEATEHAFFRSLGHSLHTDVDGGMQGWARVHAACDYKAPLRYQDLFEVRLVVREKRKTAFAYDFYFTKDGSVVARGELTVVHVARKAGEEELRPAPMPAAIDAAIEVAPPELLETRNA